MTPDIKRELRRSTDIELVVGHLNNVYGMNRNYLACPQGDAVVDVADDGRVSLNSSGARLARHGV